MRTVSYNLAELAELIDATVKGDASAIVTGIAALANAKANDLTFLGNAHHRKHLAHTQAGAVILTETFQDECPVNALIVADAELSYAKAAALFVDMPKGNHGIHSSVVVGEDCQIGKNVSIGANCVLGNRVVVGDNVIIQPGCVIGDNVTLGDNGILYANVTLYHSVQIGHHVILHSGVVIGSDGFGFAQNNGRWEKIAQLGGVHIGNNVEIGANTCVDRGAIENTVIEEGVKIDNLVQIAHNVHIGAHTVIAGCTGIAGSATVGKHCMIAGAVAINGHITLCDRVIITGCSVVSHSVEKPGIYSSGASYLQPTLSWKKNNKRFAELDMMAKRLKQLEKQQ